MGKRIRRVRKPAVSQTPNHRSYSQISKYMNCAHQYKLYYIDQIPVVGVNLDFAIGKAGHSYIEQVLTARLSSKDFSPKQREECRMTHSVAMGKQIKEDLEKYNAAQQLGSKIKAPISELRRQLEMLIKQWDRDILPEIDPIAVEQKLKTEIGGEEFVMYIDLIQNMGKNEKALVDWKFTKSTKGDRAVKDSLQLSLYSFATNINNVGFCSLVKPRKGKEKNWKPSIVMKRAHRTKADITFAINTIKDAIKGIQLDYFPRCSPENFLCTIDYCDYWPICRGKDQPQEPDWME